MGNTSPECARGQFSETQFEKLKASYELLAFKDTQLINEDTFVASFAGDGREKFGLELSMFLKSSSPAIAENPQKAEAILKAKTISLPSFIRGLERLFTRSESKRLAGVLELFSWSIRLRSDAWLADTKSLQWTPVDVEHCLCICLNNTPARVPSPASAAPPPADASASAVPAPTPSPSTTTPPPPPTPSTTTTAAASASTCKSGGGVVGCIVKEIFKAAKATSKGGGESVSYAHLRKWVLRHMPLLPNTLQTYIYARYLRPASSSRLPSHLLRAASLHKPSPDSLLTAQHAGALSLVRVSLQGPWQCLFDSSRDGMSLNRLRLAVSGYAGPTVLAIQDGKTGSVFGGCASVPWKESPKFFGDSGCFLFTLWPRFQVFQNLCTNYATENFMYMNETGHECAHGLGMGGTMGSFRLWIDGDDVDKCQTGCGSTYEPGELMQTTQDADGFSDGYFTLQRLEVWGCGGTDAMKEREHHRAEAQRMLDDMRKVDKMKLYKGAGNEFLFSKTRSNARGATGDLGALARD